MKPGCQLLAKDGEATAHSSKLNPLRWFLSPGNVDFICVEKDDGVKYYFSPPIVG
jgi:hypothetical protein